MLVETRHIAERHRYRAPEAGAGNGDSFAQVHGAPSIDLSTQDDMLTI